MPPTSPTDISSGNAAALKKPQDEVSSKVKAYSGVAQR
jgi:hypothetical protein